MGLKITLKPGERMVIGGAVITNGGAKCDLIIENRVPLLREKDIYSEDNVDTPAKRIYFVVQLMYIDSSNLTTHHHTYWGLVRDFVNAAPSSLSLIDQISENIVNNRYYPALKLAGQLVKYEEEITRGV